MRVMVSKPSIPIPRQILEQASEWFVDFRVDAVDTAARARFDRWLRQSPQHIQAYLEIATVYGELPALKQELAADLDDMLARAQRGSAAEVIPLREAASTRSRRDAPPRRHFLAVMAAAVAIVAGFSTWLAWKDRDDYATGVGEQRSVTLADGSVVDLNARTRIRVNYTRAEREIDLLEGQALFVDTEDPLRPFIVRSRGAIVRAIGTEFDINREVTRTVVTVLDGRVAVLAGRPPPNGSAVRSAASPPLPDVPGSPPILLSAGEQLAISAGVAAKPHRADLSAATAWQRRQLVFDDSRLADVVNEFNRYNRRRLTIESPALDDLRISGVYSSTNPTSFIHFLREQPGLVVTDSGGQVRISQSNSD